MAKSASHRPLTIHCVSQRTTGVRLNRDLKVRSRMFVWSGRVAGRQQSLCHARDSFDPGEAVFGWGEVDRGGYEPFGVGIGGFGDPGVLGELGDLGFGDGGPTNAGPRAAW